MVLTRIQNIRYTGYARESAELLRNGAYWQTKTRTETEIFCITALIGMFALSAALEGYCFRRESIFERIVFAAAGIMCILPTHSTDIIGIAILAALIAFQLIMKKKDALKVQN